MSSETPAAAVVNRRVLVVEDDPVLSDLFVRYLVAAGLSVESVGDGFGALQSLETSPADLVILDRMIPGVDGIEICRRIRDTSNVPIMMLTSLGQSEDRIRGLEAGADDYVVKPVSPREVTLRVLSWLNRVTTTHQPYGVVTVGRFILDAAVGQITVEGQPVHFPAREYELLAFLLRRSDQLFTKDELAQGAWGWPNDRSAATTVNIRRLRERIEHDASHPEVLKTVWGRGYLLSSAGAAA